MGHFGNFFLRRITGQSEKCLASVMIDHIQTFGQPCPQSALTSTRITASLHGMKKMMVVECRKQRKCFFDSIRVCYKVRN